MSPILVLAFIILLLFIIYDFCTARPTKNSPPGPIRLPVFGSYIQVLWENWDFPYKVFASYSERYKSPVVSFYLGDFYCISANTYESCRELFNRPEFQDRADTFPARIRAYGERLGIFFDDGPNWLHQKRFSLRELRDFGLGRRFEDFEAIVGDGVKELIEDMREKTKKDQSLVIPGLFYSTMMNNTVQLLTGKRLFGDERQYLNDFMYETLKFFRVNDPTGGALAFTPWLRFLFPKTVGYYDAVECNDKMQNFAKKLMTESKEDYEEGLRRGFIDVYNNNKGSFSHFSEDHLRVICTDLMIPSNAASQGVSYCLMFLAADLGLQRRCQEQIDDVVGQGRQPALNDRENLPLVEATLRESLRVLTMVPLAIAHVSSEDTTFCGYDVPKGTIMFPNLYAMHLDKSVFNKPETFYPERFLDYKGRINKKDYSLPFGLGRRVCSGETFARQNMFLTLATILQNFTVKPDSPIDFNLVKPGLVLNLPDNYKMKFVARD